MKIVALAALLAGIAAPASAAQIVLDFEGVENNAPVADFYNSGTDGAGNSGTDHGVNFGDSSLGLIQSAEGGSGNFDHNPSGKTIVFFTSGSAMLNVAAGFTDALSFSYTSSTSGFVNIYDGLNGTGTLLGQVAIAAQNNLNCPSGSAAFCNWTQAGTTFSGIAKSVDFGGTANQVGYDDIALGAGAVPEPATWGMMLLGFGLVGAAMRRPARAAVAA